MVSAASFSVSGFHLWPWRDEGLVSPGGAGLDDALDGDGPAGLESAADEVPVRNNLRRNGDETTSEKTQISGS